MSRCAAGRQGFALVTSVLLMIGLAVLATALAFAGAQQASLTASAHDLVRARQAAEAAAGMALADWSAAARSLEPVGGTALVLPPIALDRGVTMLAHAERVGAESYLLRATGTAMRPMEAPIEQQVLRLVRSLDLDAVGRVFDAALMARSVTLLGGAEIHGDGADAPAHDAAAAELCDLWPRDAAAVRAPADSVAIVDAALSGTPRLVPDHAATSILEGLGFLGRPDLVAAASPIRSPVVSPAPRSDGDRCETDTPGVWGAPAGACAGYAPLLHAADDLVIDGGYGQGILLTDGELLIDGGAHFRGIILALGPVTIRTAVVDGVIVAPSIRIDGGYASLDRCAIADALALATATRQARLPPRSRLPAFD